MLVLTPSLFHVIFRVFLLQQIAHVGVSVSRCFKLIGRKIIFEVSCYIFILFMYVITVHESHGQTDRHWHHRALLSIAR